MSTLAALAEVMDELVAEGPEAHAGGTSIVELYRQLARLQAVVASATVAFEASGEWGLDGARSAVAWLATQSRLPKAQLRRDIRLGHAVADRLPTCGAAWAAGEIGQAHVSTICALGGPRTDGQLARDESLLVQQASSLPFGQFRQAAAYWDQLADANGCDERDEARRSRRDVTLAESFDGMWLGQVTLDPVSGGIVAGELTRLEQVLFDADWTEARQRLGREPMPGDLERTPAQRRADALVEIASRSRSMPPGSRRPRPLFTVLVDYPTLVGRVCELSNGQVVAPGGLVRWLGAAEFERVVFGPNGRIEVGSRSRLFAGATRRAIEVRDRICAHPFCDEPVDRCQVDHVVPWSAWGSTTIDNGRLLCGYHNRLRGRQEGSRVAQAGPSP